MLSPRKNLLIPYLWMPVEIGDGKLWLPEPKPWTIDVKSGKWKYVETNSN